MFQRFTARLCAATITLANGTILKGEVNPSNKELISSGVATLPDGRVFSGRFDPLKGFPLPGSQLEEDGDLYKGEFNLSWQREGTGESWLADGTYYKGTFKGDELVKGLVRIPNGTSEVTFEGTLQDELFTYGKLSQPDFTYEGQFSDNQPHGKGKLIFSTGAEQEGTFFAGKLHGSGCKMKLDGGFVYVGEFMDGKIRSGTLYTPTYTYEGEFNEHGRAHGEGSQTYLINEPRLVFTGIWNNGAMVRGACVDEYGSPVDWQDNHQMQSKVLGDSTNSDGDVNVAVNSYCSSKLKEADSMFRDMNRSYAQDADTVARTTGTYPSKMDLGYEGGIAAENEAAARSSQQQMEQMAASREVFADRAEEFSQVSQELKNGSVIMDEFNENMAKIQFSRQMGAQQLASERVDEQFERFMKSFDRPKSSSSSGGGGTSAGEDTKLNIDGNAPWKSFTP